MELYRPTGSQAYKAESSVLTENHVRNIPGCPRYFLRGQHQLGNQEYLAGKVVYDAATHCDSQRSLWPLGRILR